MEIVPGERDGNSKKKGVSGKMGREAKGPVGVVDTLSRPVFDQEKGTKKSAGIGNLENGADRGGELWGSTDKDRGVDAKWPSSR